MPPLADRLRDAVVDLVFPPRCIGCGTGGAFLCPACVRQLPGIAAPLCPLCGKPQPGGTLCPGCWGWRASIDGIRSPFVFQGVVRQAVHALKYRNLRALSVPLGQLLARHTSVAGIEGDILVPVPLHPRRLRERGYNQSALMAEQMSIATGLAIDSTVLLRRKDTAPQARTVSVEARHQNMSGAFTCADRRLKGKRVLLVDDVCTSGATLDACAGALKRAGAASVWGLTLAKET